MAPNFFIHFHRPLRTQPLPTMAKPDKKTEKKAEKKTASAPKKEAKAKASKKAVDGDKTVSTVPSAKHSAPISSKEILARVCTHL